MVSCICRILPSGNRNSKSLSGLTIILRYLRNERNQLTYQYCNMSKNQSSPQGRPIRNVRFGK